MKLKASHHWRADGTIVIEIRDHDAKHAMPKKNPFSGKNEEWSSRQSPRVNTLVTSMDLPRGTSRGEVKMVKQSLIMAIEAKHNEVSR